MVTEMQLVVNPEQMFSFLPSWFIGGGLTNAVSLESGVVLTHDFSIRVRSTGLHQY